jgi:hypothetical protein
MTLAHLKEGARGGTLGSPMLKLECGIHQEGQVKE